MSSLDSTDYFIALSSDRLFNVPSCMYYEPTHQIPGMPTIDRFLYCTYSSPKKAIRNLSSPVACVISIGYQTKACK